MGFKYVINVFLSPISQFIKFSTVLTDDKFNQLSYYLWFYLQSGIVSPRKK